VARGFWLVSSKTQLSQPHLSPANHHSLDPLESVYTNLPARADDMEWQ